MNDALTPEEYARLIQLGGNNEDLDAQIKMQLMQAQQLRPHPLETRSNGRVTTAPHWLELLGNLAQSKVSYDKQNAAQANQSTRNANSQEQRRLMMEGILRPRPAPTEVQPGMNPFARPGIRFGQPQEE